MYGKTPCRRVSLLRHVQTHGLGRSDCMWLTPWSDAFLCFDVIFIAGLTVKSCCLVSTTTSLIRSDGLIFTALLLIGYQLICFIISNAVPLLGVALLDWDGADLTLTLLTPCLPGPYQTQLRQMLYTKRRISLGRHFRHFQQPEGVMSSFWWFRPTRNLIYGQNPTLDSLKLQAWCRCNDVGTQPRRNVTKTPDYPSDIGIYLKHITSKSV